MVIVLLSAEKDLAVTGQDIVRLFFPEARIVFAPEDNHELTLTVSAAKEGANFVARALLTTRANSLSEEVTSNIMPLSIETRNHQKRLVKLALFRLICRYTGSPLGPWGILTGIRPTKIVHRLLDIHLPLPEIIDYLVATYDMARGKARHLTEIALRQRPYLLTREQAEKTVSIYVGIPFCPTRCAYCSFPSCSVTARGDLVAPFLQALNKEIRKTGLALREFGKTVQTIYIGGGTPTILEAGELELLLSNIGDNLVTGATAEITLEAGRPDTINRKKLKVALDHGVNRLSVNPQSMNQRTLETIGRMHTPGEVVTAVDMARQVGFGNINMDIIIGLPGESLTDVQYTLREICKIEPENLTVHTLAVKRASKIKEFQEAYVLPPWDTVQTMQEMTGQAAADMGMHPYYLYRQKKMVGPLENIGYARAGFNCLYNIQIIGERQTILGLGGGAGSKFVDPRTWSLTSHYNPKDPEHYIARIDELIARKISMLKGSQSHPNELLRELPTDSSSYKLR